MAARRPGQSYWEDMGPVRDQQASRASGVGQSRANMTCSQVPAWHGRIAGCGCIVVYGILNLDRAGRVKARPRAHGMEGGPVAQQRKLEAHMPSAEWAEGRDLGMEADSAGLVGMVCVLDGEVARAGEEERGVVVVDVAAAAVAGSSGEEDAPEGVAGGGGEAAEAD